MAADVNDIIDALAFWSFWLLLFVATVSVIGRVAFYRSHHYRLPRLLIRDAFLFGGFALSFGLILLARTAGLTNLADNTAWKLLTDVPAVGAVGVFVYFELVVIERGRDSVRDARYHDPRYHDPALHVSAPANDPTHVEGPGEPRDREKERPA